MSLAGWQLGVVSLTMADKALSISPRPSGPLAPGWWGEILLAERSRWALWAPVALATGIGLFFALPDEPPPAAIWLWTVPALMWLVGRRRRPLLALLYAALGLALLGFAIAQFRSQRLATEMLDKAVGPLLLEATVEGVEARPGGGWRIVLRRAMAVGRDIRLPDRLRVTLRPARLSLHGGDRIRLRARLLPPSPPLAPGAFDFARQAYFSRLGAVGYGLGAPEILTRGTGGGGFGQRLSSLRRTIAEKVQAFDGRPAAAVAVALMTGQRGAIPAPVVAAFRDSGLAHLLAISGLHIGLVAGFVFFVVRLALALSERAALHLPIKKIAAVAALMAAFLYLLISGATVPTRRAFIMTAIILLAVLLDRRALSMRTVAIAALIVLAGAPESLISVSFQLSFAAVVALVAFYEYLGGAHPSLIHPGGGVWRRLGYYLIAVALTTIVAEAATAPFAAWHFNRLVVYGLAANVIAVPMMAFWIMPAAVMALLLMPLGLEGLALWPMLKGLDGVIAVASTVSAWDGAVRGIAAGPLASLVALAIGGLWLALWRRPWRLLGLLPLIGGLAFWAAARSPDVWVNEQASLLAVRGADGGLIFSAPRGDRRSRETWLRRAGFLPARMAGRGSGRAAANGSPGSQASQTSQTSQTSQASLACDRLGCLYRPGQGRPLLAFARRIAALDDDCRHIALIISAVPLFRRCPSARLAIDRFRLWRQGAHALWLSPATAGAGAASLRIESVAGQSGHRRWSPYSRRRRQGR